MAMIVGLTGGIGSGKSTVARLFSELGAEVIDTDEIARQIVEPGSPALARIAANFGAELVNADGALDRTRLRELVFADAAKRRQLEQILHPLIRERVIARLQRASSAYCILVVPLLIESDWTGLVDRILVVDAPESVQSARTMARDGLTAEEVRAIMRVQASRQARLDRATDVITNDRDVEFLSEQVRRLHSQYQRSGSAYHGTKPGSA